MSNEIENSNVVVCKFTDAFNARIAHERSKQEQITESNFKKLEAAKQRMTNSFAVAMLEASHVDASFVNRSVTASERFEIYALEKAANYMLAATTNTQISNAIDFHIFKTAKNFAEAKLSFTKEDAADACSAHRKLAKDKKALVSQRAQTLADSTCTRQAQATLQALLALNVLSKAYNEKRETVYTANTDNAIYQALAANV